MMSMLAVFNVILDAIITITQGKANLNSCICHNRLHLESSWKTALDQ